MTVTGSLLLLALAQSPADIQKRAADAYGLSNQKGNLAITGSVRQGGKQRSFKFLIDNTCRYRADEEGVLPFSSGFDGKTTWGYYPSGTGHPLAFLMKDWSLFLHWTITGEWANSETPVTVTLDPNAKDSNHLLLKPNDGSFFAKLTLDGASGLPSSAEFDTSGQIYKWDMSDYKEFGGRKLPTHVEINFGDNYVVDDVKPAAEDANAFTCPPNDDSLFRYDSTESPKVKAKRVSGLMLVQAKVDGHKAGWFVLDTGANRNVIDSRLASKLGLVPAEKGVQATGVSGYKEGSLDKAKELQLGPACLENPVFFAMDLKDLSKALRFPISGICGYDLFSRTVIHFDPKSEILEINDPASPPEVPGLQWEPFDFTDNMPVVEAKFAPGNKGLFHLDTGMDGTVDFFTPAVDQFGLSKIPNLKSYHSTGVSGTSTAMQGTLDWFELKGYRFAAEPVTLQTTNQGVYASTYEQGNIGMAIMGFFDIVFDYPHLRVGFRLPNVGGNGK